MKYGIDALCFEVGDQRTACLQAVSDDVIQMTVAVVIEVGDAQLSCLLQRSKLVAITGADVAALGGDVACSL